MSTRKVDLEKEQKRAKQPAGGYEVKVPEKDKMVEEIHRYHKELQLPSAWRSRRERASKSEEKPPEPLKDQYGCIVGEEVWDGEKCVPSPPKPAEVKLQKSR